MNLNIRKTTNLNLFTPDPLNRDLNEAHVIELQEKIAANGFNPNYYITVNGNMMVVSGHHRLEAVRREHKKGNYTPIYYHVDPNAKLADRLNDEAMEKPWVDADFVKYYAVWEDSKNREEYQTLRDLIVLYGDTISLNILCKICLNTANNNVSQTIRSGEFKIIRNYDEVVRICEYIKDLSVPLKKAKSVSRYKMALIWVMTNNEIDTKALSDQIKKYPERLYVAHDVKEALANLSKVYHYMDRRSVKLRPILGFDAIYKAELDAIKEDRKAMRRKQRASEMKKSKKAVTVKEALPVQETMIKTEEEPEFADTRSILRSFAHKS